MMRMGRSEIGRSFCAFCKARLPDAETTDAADPGSNELAARDIAAAKALHEKMSALSERHWCAGWLVGTEIVLWEILTRGADRRWGFSEIDQRSIDELRDLHEKAGGWWWSEERNAPRFERTGRWSEIYEELKSGFKRIEPED
jgi:hypothetical protein